MDTSEVVDNILLHFGKKGMKWGVHNRVTKSSGFKRWSKMSEANVQRHNARQTAKAQKKLSKPDRKFDKTFASKSKTNQLKVELHNNIGHVVQSKVNRLNASPKYAKAISDGRLKNGNAPITKQYIKDYNKIYMTEMNGYLKGFQSPMGKTVKAELNSSDFLGFSLKVQNARGAKIKHADEADELLIRVNYIRDEVGRIVDFEIVDDELVQTDLFIGDILEHFGKKGMKWGVRKRDTSKRVTVVDKGKRLKTSGGHGHKTDPSALNARVIGQKAKASGLKSLTDDELKAYASRLNLEQNVGRLQYNEKHPAEKFIRKILGQTGDNSVKAASDEIVTQRVRRVFK